jgi:uncharacterized membrane protein YdjX (TVP38/TMEM64 family)
VLPYTLATVAGVLPGTAAVVILGDALTGHVSPLLFMVSLCIGLAGITLLACEIRLHRRHAGVLVPKSDDAAGQSLRG